MLSKKPWRVEFVIQLIAGVFVCLCLGMMTVGVLRQAGVAAFKSPDSFAPVLVATLSFQGAVWILMFVFFKLHDVNWRDAFGFRNAHLFRSLLLAAIVFVPALLVALGLQQVSILALTKMGWTPQDERAVELIANAGSPWLRAYLGFFAVVLAPVAEEFIFRGMLFPFVKQLGWPKLAWFGVSFLFALIHFNAPTFLSLFVLALALAWLYEKTDCLLAPIAAHSLFNIANLFMLRFQEQINDFLLKVSHFIHVLYERI